MSALSERPPDPEQFRLVGRGSQTNIQHCNATHVQSKQWIYTLRVWSDSLATCQKPRSNWSSPVKVHSTVALICFGQSELKACFYNKCNSEIHNIWNITKILLDKRLNTMYGYNVPLLNTFSWECFTEKRAKILSSFTHLDVFPKVWLPFMCGTQKKTFRRMFQPFFFIEWKSKTTETFFKISSFVLHRRKQTSRLWNNVKVSKSLQILHWWVNYLFKINIIVWFEFHLSLCHLQHFLFTAL